MVVMTDDVDKATESYDRVFAKQIAPKNYPTNVSDECIDCGNPIGERRKQALPHAIRCVGCQWQRERTHD